MTKEEKDLLLKDLCGRLPYGVQVFVERDEYTQATLLGIDTKQFSIIFGGNHWSSTSDIEGHHIEQYKQIVKPYLRPMSSMTEEEKIEYNELLDDCKEQDRVDYNITILDDSMLFFVIDWLNKKMFDYRGLIPMGLALPAKEGMYE